MSGGGSSSGTQTQITDVPDWAKPYAKTALGQASQLTDITKNPYQSYTGDRQAQFTPLQQQAYQGAAGMQAGPGGFQSQVGQYMSPYMDNVVAAQQRGAQREADIQGQTQGAQAARAGAFGGGRQAIMQSEAARNLASQKGDIQGKGLQAAYDSATNQYNQGFGQNMALNQQQNQFGNQQQQQVQNILNNNYQDFQDQKRYPYQQLEFMSGLMRGTPMGTVQSMYQPPGSSMGQLAGLGMGAYGLSQMGMKFKDGGDVRSYEGGGSISRPSEEKLADMVDGLTDEQLQQIIQRPTSIAAYRAAEEELALRASMERGIAGAANGGLMDRMLPTEQSMARGGVVAFANGGNEGERTSMAGDLLRGIVDPITSGLRATAEYGKLKEDRDKARPGFFEQLTKGEREARIAQAKELSSRMKQVGGSSESKPANKAADPYDPATATRRDDFKNNDKAPSKVESFKGISNSNKTIINSAVKVAEEAGTPKETFLADVKSLMNELKDRSSEDLKGINESILKSLKDSGDIKKDMFNKAITEFGFNMAAKASEPGKPGNKGLRGVLQSAAAAAPTFAASVNDSQRLARAAEDNARKMQVEFTKYKVALDKGDQQSAVAIMSNIRQLQQADNTYKVQLAQLDEQKRYHNMIGAKHAAAGEGAALKRAQLGLQARKQGETRAMNEFKDPIAAMEYKKRGITPDMLAKQYAKEEQGALLSSMITGFRPEED
jgi:hypothetical protein